MNNLKKGDKLRRIADGRIFTFDTNSTIGFNNIYVEESAFMQYASDFEKVSDDKEKNDNEVVVFNAYINKTIKEMFYKKDTLTITTVDGHCMEIHNDKKYTHSNYYYKEPEPSFNDNKIVIIENDLEFCLDRKSWYAVSVKRKKQLRIDNQKIIDLLNDIKQDKYYTINEVTHLLLVTMLNVIELGG